MLSLVIPCSNEEENLNKLLDCIDLLYKKYSEERIEVIIVDNGSTDNSNELIKKNNLFLDKKINLIEIEKNVGYGDGITKGISSCTGNFVAWCHADLQADLEDIIEIFLKSKQKLKNEDCIIKGKRINRGILDAIFTSGMTVITFLLFQTILNDINAQPKIFRKSFIKKLDNPPKDFSYDLFFLLRARKEFLSIYEYPIVWNKRYAGQAKGGGSIKLKIKLTLRTLKFMFKLLKNSKWN